MNVITPLRREPGTALHRQLFMVLRDRIHQGAYVAGDAIPPEDELGARFGVSRITVRRAISDLEGIGLVEKRPGRGTFVKAFARSERAQPSLGLLETLSKHARDTEVEVLRVEMIAAPAAIASQLGLASSESAIHAVRLRSVKSVPVMVTDAWVPLRVGGNVNAEALKKHALFEILLAEGIKFGRVVQELAAVPADPAIASLLQVDISSPLLRLTRLMYDRRKRATLHNTIHFNSERSRLLMDVPADAVNTMGTGQIIHDGLGFKR